MSKYIKNSRIQNQPRTYDWMSKGMTAYDREEKKSREEYYKKKESEKERIESIPLEELSFRDLYKFPFHQATYGSWVYDANSNFIFQFEIANSTAREKIIKILNGEVEDYNRREVRGDEGYVEVKIEEEWKKLILIRGWGNLTGVGAYNLDGDYAAKIQDTLEQYIVEKLNK